MKNVLCVADASGRIEYARETGSGRLPWYCRPCVEEIYVARIQARNAADKEVASELPPLPRLPSEACA